MSGSVANPTVTSGEGLDSIKGLFLKTEAKIAELSALQSEIDLRNRNAEALIHELETLNNEITALLMLDPKTSPALLATRSCLPTRF